MKIILSPLLVLTPLCNYFNVFQLYCSYQIKCISYKQYSFCSSPGWIGLLYCAPRKGLGPTCSSVLKRRRVLDELHMSVSDSSRAQEEISLWKALLKICSAGMELPAGPLTGLDVCIRKPLIATTCLDKAVRLWNWHETSLELCKYFQDEAFSVALHPNGLLLLVGFADKLRMMAILMDDLKVSAVVKPSSLATTLHRRT
jgi:hypothetical protein